MGCKPGKNNITPLIKEYLTINPPKNDFYSISFNNGITLNHSNCLYEKYNIKFFTEQFGSLETKVKFNYKTFEEKMIPDLKLNSYILKNDNNSNFICCLYLKHERLTIKDTILFCHNAINDLGSYFPFLIDMFLTLKVNIISYDYSSFGVSIGKFSEEHLYNEIIQIIEFANKTLYIPFNKIILLGESLGSIPVLYISSNEKYLSQIKGIILLSPIVKRYNNYLDNEKNTISFNKDDYQDENNNLNRIKNIIKPIFIIHGRLDSIIPQEHINEMTKNTYDFLSWYPKEGNHYNILINCRMKFFKKIKQFLIILNKEKTSKKEITDENLLEIDTYSDYFENNKKEKKHSDIKIYIKEYNSNKTQKTDNTEHQNYINKNQTKKKKGYRKNSTFFDIDYNTKEENKLLFSPSPSSSNEFEINNNSIESSSYENNNST